MSSTRRNFLQLSATAASALTLGPLTLPGVADAAAREGQQATTPAVAAFERQMLRARRVPLGKVRLTGGPLKHAQELDAAYLLSLDPDRMLAYYRVRAGLPQKAEPYGGWDGDGHNLTGHIAGHHLSAVSYMYEATGDERFKARATYLVDGLKEVQDKNGDGYLSALQNGREAFTALSHGDIRSKPFDLNGLWSPWYVLHKTFAGLRDAYRHTGNRTALDVELKFAAWADGILAPLSFAQLQAMLDTEHGGMNEVLADLYADTGDRRWLTLSEKFEHHAFTDPLKRHEDDIGGKHGNCQIPKLCGSAARYGYTGQAEDILAASFFWDRVVQHHSYASGGHGLDEYFGPADGWAHRIDGRTCESCNVYNMLKLTRRLFSLRPDAFYADFQERALFNHVLASIDPADGRMCYMVPIGRGEAQEYQDMQRSFTCCVGSGMENHALHGDGVYYESDDAVWVTQFVPSTAELARPGVSLKMETGFPDGDTATITVTARVPSAFTLIVRRPGWAGDGFAAKVNGTPVILPVVRPLNDPAGGRPEPFENTAIPVGSFVEIPRTWKSGDTVELSLPKSLRLEPAPDDPGVVAMMWGPLALAADLGPRPQRGGRGGGGGAPAPAPPQIPVYLAADQPPADWIKPVAGQPGNFTVPDVARVDGQPTTPAPVSLAPFYRTYDRTYSVYADLTTPADWSSHMAAIAAARERVRKIDAAVVGRLQPGSMTSERETNYQAGPQQGNARPILMNGQPSIGGVEWFSADLPVDPQAAMAVVVTYMHARRGAPAGPPAAFEILVDGTSVGRYDPAATPAASDDSFDYAAYPIPASLSTGKQKVTVKFQADAQGRIAPIFGVCTVRADAIR